MAVYFTHRSVRRRVIPNQRERKEMSRGSRDGVIQTRVTKIDVDVGARSVGERVLRRNQLSIGTIASELTDAFRWSARRRRRPGRVCARVRRGQVDRFCSNSREKINSRRRNHGPFTTARRGKGSERMERSRLVSITSGRVE